MDKKLKFKRGLDDARKFEIDALKGVGGFGGTFPGNNSRDGVEAQMTVQEAVSEDSLTVFFRLVDTYGAEYVIAMDPVMYNIYAERFYAWPSDDGISNVSITDEIVNGRFVLTHVVNNDVIRQFFEPAYNYYVPEGWEEAAIKQHLQKARMISGLVEAAAD